MKKNASIDTAVEEEFHYDGPSRSARKREAQAQTDLVPELLELSKLQLKKFTFVETGIVWCWC